VTRVYLSAFALVIPATLLGIIGVALVVGP
jgi:hypothetical protein